MKVSKMPVKKSKLSKPAPEPRKIRSAKRKAAQIDPAAKWTNLVHLNRAGVQVDGVTRMVEADRYCAPVIIKITEVRATLKLVAEDLLFRHLKESHNAAMNDGGAVVDAMYQELVGLVTEMAK